MKYNTSGRIRISHWHTASTPFAFSMAGVERRCLAMSNLFSPVLFLLQAFGISIFWNFWLIFAAQAVDPTQPFEVSQKWWKNAAIYQVYPLSLRDSNNDGRGDLKGITEKVSYLKKTGFEAIWLSPIYSSPMVDFGYDISNFTEIHEWYGTMEDFDRLSETVHGLGMKLIMDFVPNHSSDKHDWFIRSCKREPGYEDYYVWKDPKGMDDKGKPIPPNNWISMFYGPAWTYHEDRKQFYLHQFASAQPDLNYRNPKVVEEMKNVIRFWIGRGVDGFRMDAIPFLFEEASFKDEPVAGGNDPLSIEYLHHIYTQNMSETYEMVQQWREIVDKADNADGKDRCLMVEVYASVEDTMKYFGTKNRPGAHFPFNFNLIDINNQTTAQEVKRNINSWIDHLPQNGHSNWLVGNHDHHRIGSRVGEDLIDGMNALVLLLPGTSVTYYGEEIGMTDNTDITYEEGVDPQGCNYPREEFAKRTRDFQRTPFQWDDSINAGFNTGAKTWLPVNKNYREKNLKAQENQPYSHYTFFSDLMRTRKSDTVRNGKLLLEVVGRGTLGVVRGLGADDFVVLLVNFSYQDDLIDLNTAFLLGERQLVVVTADANSGFRKGQKVDITEFTLPERSTLVLGVKQ